MILKKLHIINTRNKKLVLAKISLLFCLICVISSSFAQNNVGIGTDTIHPSAILQIEDTAKGLLIPRVIDTTVINQYITTIFPNPGITDGLIIYSVTDSKYYYYDGVLKKWVASNRLIGAVGPTGPTGILGPMGITGISNDWRSDFVDDPFVRPGDTCDDLFHQTTTGKLWVFNCDSNDWILEGRMRTLGFGETEYLGPSTFFPTSPDLYAPMPSTGDSLFLIDGLTRTIEVPPDTVAYVTFHSIGSVKKRFPNDSLYNHVIFDYFMTPPTGPGAYLDQRQIVTIGPNIAISMTDPDGIYHVVPWHISTTMTLEGKISPKGSPLPGSDVNVWTFETHGGQRHLSSNPMDSISDVSLIEKGAGNFGDEFRAFSTMQMYITFERSLKAPYPE